MENSRNHPEWMKLSKDLAKSLTKDHLHSKTIHFIEQLKVDEPLAIACSGGADSIFLLLSIAGFFPERRHHLIILHFNHCLRGKHSDKDKTFTSEVAKGINTPFISERWNHCLGKSVSEEKAREARHAFFLRAMQSFSGKILLLGHQQNDIAETLLMRLSRGSGARGLSAPRPIQTFSNGFTYLRPLLHLKRDRLVAFLQSLGIPWREDESNQENDFFRNRVRHDMIPIWQKTSPQDIFTGTARSRLILEEEDAALESWLDTLLPINWHTFSCDLSTLSFKPNALLRRAIHRWLGAHHLQDNLSSKGFDLLMHAFIHRYDYKLSVGNKGFILHRDGVFCWHFEQSIKTMLIDLPIPVGVSLFWPNGSMLKSAIVALDNNRRHSILSGHIDTYREAWLDIGPFNAEKSISVLRIKNWEKGDAYIPLGAPGQSKLQDCFTNRKIPQKERNQLPVVCNKDGKILWVPGLLPCENFKINFYTEYGLRLTYH